MNLKIKSYNSKNYIDISNYLAEGSKIGWYDVSKNSGREVSNANGDMILNVINDKYRIDIVTRYLSKEEFLHLFSEITHNPRLYEKFECPFTGKEKELLMYRGDRNSEEKWEKSIDNVIYKGVSLAIIQI